MSQFEKERERENWNCISLEGVLVQCQRFERERERERAYQKKSAKEMRRGEVEQGGEGGGKVKENRTAFKD